jgi:hypothetical protein
MSLVDLAEGVGSGALASVILLWFMDRTNRRRARMVRQLLETTDQTARAADESWERLQRLVTCRCNTEGAPEDPEPFGGRLNLPPRVTSENVGGQVRPAPKSPRDEYPYA